MRLSRRVCSSIIEFRADKFEPAAGNPIGLPLFRGDGSPSLELAEQAHVETWRAPTLSIDADHAFDLAALAAFNFDPPALREQVQNALFSA